MRKLILNLKTQSHAITVDYTSFRLFVQLLDIVARPLTDNLMVASILRIIKNNYIC